MFKKSLGAAALLSVMTLPAEAALINIAGIVFDDSSSFFKNGVFYVDSPSAIGVAAKGIGKVNEIRSADGTVVWTDGDNGRELSFVFDHYVRADEVPTFGSTVAYGDIGGIVDFYSNVAGTFTPTGNFTADSMTISMGQLFLGLQGSESTTGYTIEGIDTGSGISGNGYLDVVGGLASGFFDTNLFNGGNSDMSFNYSGDDSATANYDYSGSADLAVTTTAVPEPATIALMGLGLCLTGLAGYRTRS